MKYLFIDFINKNKRTMISIKTTVNASPEQLNDYQFMKSAIKTYAAQLKYASKKLRKNYFLVKLAINSYGSNSLTLSYASDGLRNNYKIVMLAVEQNAGAYQFASERLQNNFEIIKIAIEKTYDFHPLRYVSEEHTDNITFFYKLIEHLISVENKCKSIKANKMFNSNIPILSKIDKLLTYASDNINNLIKYEQEIYHEDKLQIIRRLNSEKQIRLIRDRLFNGKINLDIYF